MILNKKEAQQPACRDGGERVKFVGYSSKLTVNLSAGTILLDATADIDGISRVVLWQADVEVPQAHYDNLEIIQVPQHIHLSRLLRLLSMHPFKGTLDDPEKGSQKHPLTDLG